MTVRKVSQKYRKIQILVKKKYNYSSDHVEGDESSDNSNDTNSIENTDESNNNTTELNDNTDSNEDYDE